MRETAPSTRGAVIVYLDPKITKPEERRRLEEDAQVLELS